MPVKISNDLFQIIHISIISSYPLHVTQYSLYWIKIKNCTIISSFYHIPHFMLITMNGSTQAISTAVWLGSLLCQWVLFFSIFKFSFLLYQFLF
ncbi:unnamed protein product [Caenorhabditis nigoni]